MDILRELLIVAARVHYFYEFHRYPNWRDICERAMDPSPWFVDTYWEIRHGALNEVH